VIGAATRYVPLLLVAVAWEASTRLGLVSPALLPPLSQVLEAWLALATDGELVRHGAASLLRSLAGLLLAVAIGAVLGVGMAWATWLRVGVNPLVQLLYPLPKSALIPVMIVWLGLGHASKIGVIFLGCLLPVVLSAFNGARGVDTALIWSARGMGATRGRVLWEVVVPAALPEILSGVRIAIALSFVLLVSSEFVGAREGLGYLISFLGEGGVYDAMFAAVLTVAALGFIADRLYLLLARRALAWREA
jgi:ABC-type nitrate/sulfonate/bicarbonate transport system permease component